MDSRPHIRIGLTDDAQIGSVGFCIDGKTVYTVMGNPQGEHKRVRRWLDMLADNVGVSQAVIEKTEEDKVREAELVRYFDAEAKATKEAA